MYNFVHSKNPEKFLPIKNEFHRSFASNCSRIEWPLNKCDHADAIYAVVGESECLRFMNDQQEFTYSYFPIFIRFILIKIK